MSKNDALYMIRKDCYYRYINEYGYITSAGLFKDVVLDYNGSVFLNFLSYYPKKLSNLSKSIFDYYSNTDKTTSYDTIEMDAREFYDDLVEYGFLVKGYSEEEILNNNIGFKYKNLHENEISFYTEKSSQDYLDLSFLNNKFLFSFQIELTSTCNERCVHCYIPHELKISNITDDLFYRTIDQLVEMNALSVTLSGGEPMLHPHFKDYLQYAKNKGLFVHILSNLTLLDDDIIRLLRDENTATVQVSLYSMIPEHHDSITCFAGSFKKTKESILKLIENDIPLQISCIVMKENRDDVYDVIKWGHDHNVRVNIDYSIMAEYNHDTNNLVHRLTPEDCRMVIKNIIEIDEDYKNLLDGEKIEEFQNYKIESDKPFCGVGFNTCCMVANGNVYPCPGWQGMVLGNLNEQSLKDIWENSEKLNKLRQLRRKDMPKCMNCEERAFCSPCLSRFANESKTGNPLEVAEHFCKVAKVNKEVVLDYINKNRKEK